MGLEEFVDIDTSEPEEDSETETESIEAVNSGPYGYSSFEEYEDTVTGHIEKHGDLFKYRLPIFSVINYKEVYNTGSRYTLGPEKAIISCISSEITKLGDIPRDVIMLDTGQVEKQDCIDVLSNRFEQEISTNQLDREITPDANVTLSTFNYVRHVVKMALGDSMTDDWTLKQKDHVLKSIYNESYTQEFRESKEIDGKLKKTDHIGDW